jgi:hypothetical protein
VDREKEIKSSSIDPCYLWAFLDVRKNSELQNDVASLSFVHIIIAGVLGAIIFMAILLLIVQLVVSN